MEKTDKERWLSLPDGECPNYGKGINYMQCGLKGRECSHDCEYMEQFERRMRLGLNMKV